MTTKQPVTINVPKWSSKRPRGPRKYRVEIELVDAEMDCADEGPNYWVASLHYQMANGEGLVVQGSILGGENGRDRACAAAFTKMGKFIRQSVNFDKEFDALEKDVKPRTNRRTDD